MVQNDDAQKQRRCWTSHSNCDTSRAAAKSQILRLLLCCRSYCVEKVEATLFLTCSGWSRQQIVTQKWHFRSRNMPLPCAVIARKSLSQPNSVSLGSICLAPYLYFLVQLDGFTIDYMPEPDNELYALGGKHFFTAIKEGDELKFATDDENERHLWVQALYRATGQAYKPVPPKPASGALAPTKAQGFADKASKHGLDDFIQADPIINHDNIFAHLQVSKML